MHRSTLTILNNDNIIRNKNKTKSHQHQQLGPVEEPTVILKNRNIDKNFKVYSNSNCNNNEQRPNELWIGEDDDEKKRTKIRDEYRRLNDNDDKRSNYKICNKNTNESTNYFKVKVSAFRKVEKQHSPSFDDFNSIGSSKTDSSVSSQTSESSSTEIRKKTQDTFIQL